MITASNFSRKPPPQGSAAGARGNGTRLILPPQLRAMFAVTEVLMTLYRSAEIGQVVKLLAPELEINAPPSPAAKAYEETDFDPDCLLTPS